MLQRQKTKLFTLREKGREEVNFCLRYRVLPLFYARWLLYHNVELPYKALKGKIQKNRYRLYTVTIALITVPRWMAHWNQLWYPVPWRSRCLRIRHGWPMLANTLKKVSESQHTRMSLGGVNRKNKFYQNKQLIYGKIQNKRVNADGMVVKRFACGAGVRLLASPL